MGVLNKKNQIQMAFVEIFTIVLLIFLSVFSFHVKRRRESPPGPLGIPLVGVLPYRLIELLFTKWVKKKSDASRFKENKLKYGSLWSVEIGRQRLITLASWDLINEAFLGNADLFAGRSQNSAYKVASHGRGLIFTDGEMWRGHRNLAIKSLKKLGMGRNDLEARISEEADDLVSFLESNSSSTTILANALNKGVSNVITRLVFSHGNDYDDPSFERYIENLRYFAHSDIANQKLRLFPFLFQTRIARRFCPDVDKFLKANEYCYRYIKDKCFKRSKTFSNDEPPDCVFDYFYKDRFLDNSEVSTEEQKKEIIQTMYDLFNAGTDTTSNLLSFAFVFLGKYQKIQIDLRNEICELSEDFRNINLNMRINCPKILSFLDEVHRFSSIIPKAHHRVIKDCIFHGFKLYPQDIIFADLVNIHFDPNLFENPNEFNAYRFLDKSRTKYIPSKYLIPFGIGKRSCLGESIATMESFLFFTKILQNFFITLPEETNCAFDTIVEGHSGIIHAPLEHLINLNITDKTINSKI